MFKVLINSGEDETSFLRHNRILLSEKSKSHPNMALVDDLMEKTFYFRRKDIIDNPCGIALLLQKYPYLGGDGSNEGICTKLCLVAFIKL